MIKSDGALLSGLVLAGGYSSRMGRDKAALVYDGQTLLERAARCLRPFCDELFLSLRADQAVSSPHFDDVIRDELREIGPAAALLAAHDRLPTRSFFVLACDFPRAETAAVRELLNEKTSYAACFEHGDGTPEPLFALWHPSALRRLCHRVAGGRTGPIGALRDGPTLLVKPSRTEWLRNANTPEQFRAALEA